MTRYRLPDLIGLELVGRDRSVLHGVEAVSLELPDGTGYIDVPLSLLTKVEPPPPPPPPPEPSNFSTVRVGARAYVRDDNNSHLSWVGPDGRREWSELGRIADEKTGFPPVLLVPAPEPVELPWHAICSAAADDVLRIKAPDSDNHVFVGIQGTRGADLRIVYLSAEQARDAARALWTAADAAEAQS